MTQGTIQTMGIILGELGLTGQNSYRMDTSLILVEWCFGSFDGAYRWGLIYGTLYLLMLIIMFVLC